MKSGLWKKQIVTAVVAAAFVVVGMVICLILSCCALPVSIEVSSRLADVEMTLDTIPQFRYKSAGRNGDYEVLFTVSDRERFVKGVNATGNAGEISNRLIASKTQKGKYDDLRIYVRNGMYFYFLIPADKEQPMLFSEMSGTLTAGGEEYYFPCSFVGAALDFENGDPIRMKWLDLSYPGVPFGDFDSLARFYSGMPQLAEIDYDGQTVTLAAVKAIHEESELGNGERQVEISDKYCVTVTCDEEGITVRAVRKGES